MNNWTIGKLLRVIVAIQFALLGLIGFAFIGHDIPFLRQVIGFIYLAFIPGILILRILKLHKLDYIETLLYSVGLSIAFVMFLGFFMNMLYPLIGISKPISILPLVVTLTVAVTVLCIIAYLRESRETTTYSEHHSVFLWSEIFSPPALFLVLLPFLTILGTQLVNFNQNSILLFILLLFIALIVALVAFNRFIPQGLYPLAIMVIAISLLWHCSLISQYLIGSDIQVEYYLQNIVLANSIWNYAISGNANAMLSIVMLAPIYSLILNMDPVWVFKIIYPLFFSLVPLALFQAYRKQTDDTIAFLGVFFFMSIFTFFIDMNSLARQQIAELFFALSILLFLDKEMVAIKRAILLIIFGLAIVVSHYGLSYFYMFYLLLTLFLLSLTRSSSLSNLWESLSNRLSKDSSSTKKAALPPNPALATPSIITLSTPYVMLFTVFCLAWYMYISSGSAFARISLLGDQLYHGLAELFNAKTRDPFVLQALGLKSMGVEEIEWEIARIIQQVTQLLIGVGVLGLIANWRRTRFHLEYALMSLVSMVIIAMCVILPYFSTNLNMSRTYHITLFFLAPFCILGGITVFKWLFKLAPSKLFRTLNNSIHLKLIIMLILIPYFLFQTGFIFEVTNATPISYALNSEMDYRRFNKQELSGKTWLLLNKKESAKVCADYNGTRLFLGHIPDQTGVFYGGTAEVPNNTYIYLRSWNVKNRKVDQPQEFRVHEYVSLQDSSFGKKVLVYRSKIYDNSGTQVYYK